jgi:alkylation response protein AidB-like acyl-CoA dehydrogenase
METDLGFDRGTWARLGSEIGALGLSVPESMGGSGAGLVEQAIVCEEFGACLLPGPVFGTVDLAIPLLVALGGDEALPGVVQGQHTAAVAIPEDDCSLDEAAIRLRESGGLVTGELSQVVDGTSDLLIVAAKRDEGFGLFLVTGGERVVLPTLDQTRRQARVVFDGVPARLLATGEVATAAAERALCVGAVLLAAEQVGGAQRLLDMCVAYATSRLQFGRPIGSFQAVKHRCADMLVQLEHARSAAYYAASALQASTDDPQLVASIAKATCSEAFQFIANSSIQIHGGLGFTWEHPAHLYLKRAVTDAAWLGTAEQHRDRIASLVLDAAGNAE